ncbi:MAG TPA: ferric reductase-like transmembrane domain-containing protein [Nitrolancea sp.]|nr:ferric reductase-like transmembrane domain-containing protein [Nitrolancea sp.]
MSGSLTWYVARGSGIAAYLLLTLSVAAGIALSRRWHGRTLPRLVVDGWHRWLTLSFYLFVALHVVTLLLDPFTKFQAPDLLVPFFSDYRPLWTSLGIIAAELGLALGASVLVRRWIGYRAWHILHGLTYLLFPLSLLHGLGDGSDSRTVWALALYAGSALLVLAAVAWRAADSPRWRLPAVTAGAVVTVAILLWSLVGPLAPGWAKAAGTPARLLDQAHEAQPASVIPADQSRVAALPAGLSEPIAGQVLLLNNGSQVLLRGSTGSGSRPLDLALQIDNRDAGGSGEVQLRTSDQTPVCAGPIGGNRDRVLTATCSGYGQSYSLRITLSQVDIGGFSGTLTVLGGPHV